MSRTSFSGPVASANGFLGTFTGDVTGNVLAADNVATASISSKTGTVSAEITAATGYFQFDQGVGGSVQALSGAGAVSLLYLTTAITSTGAAQALTLANGTVGQVKVLVHTVDGGSSVLTPTTKIGFTTITFTAVGDAATLVYTGTGWAIVGINGAVAA